VMNHNSAISLIPKGDRSFSQAGLEEIRAFCYAHAPLLPTSFFLNSFLNAFACHSLDDQSSAALMDRVDTKFVFPMRSLLEFLVELRDDYTILEQNHRRIFAYETTYFDTPERLFYHSHHNGKLNRNKVRFRHYQDSNTGFMEVKLKTNKDRAIKKRMPLSPQNPDFSGTKKFLFQSLDIRGNGLGSEFSIAMIGINYLWSKDLKLMANYLALEISGNTLHGDGSGDAISMRLQLRF